MSDKYIYFAYMDNIDGKIYYDKALESNVRYILDACFLPCGAGISLDCVYDSLDALIKRESRLSSKFSGYKRFRW